MKAWAIKAEQIIMLGTVRSLRKYAIRAAENGYKRDWKIMRTEGFSVVKVEITEIKPAK